MCTPPIMSMCIYRAVDRETHKVEETGLCTEYGSVCIATLGVETPLARNESPRWIYIHTVNRADSYSTH